jgi:DNA-binding beta-propeller fold protein YncE
MRRVIPALVGTILFAGLATAPHNLISRTQTSPDFVHFESAHVHPACLTPSGDRLLVVNTPDNRLSVFDLAAGPLSSSSRIAEIPVGLEPVSVAALSDSEAWVVNQLSDDISIVNLNTMHVRSILRVGDDPGDVVFAGSPVRAYVSVAQFDLVKVIDPANLSTVATIAVGGRLPRALARTADGSKVYVAMMQANNRTSILSASRLPEDSIPQDIDFPKDTLNGNAPKTSFIIQQQGQDWFDFYGNLWNSKIKYQMADAAVVEISTATNSVTRSFGGWGGGNTRLGSENLALAVSPADGRIAVTNTRARNLLRFEPRLIGYLVETQYSSIDQGGTINDRKLNPHIDYLVAPGTQAEADSAIGIPTGVAYSGNGLRAYVTSLATDKLAVVNPYGGPLSTVRARVSVLEGPTGVVVDPARPALYVVGRMRNQVQSVSTATLAAGAPVSIGFDPTPNAIVHGRKFFYGGFTSAHGDQSCASCHTFGDSDELGWDLGDPAGASLPAPAGQPDPLLQGSHPMKGPMVTQSLRGLPNTGLLHWRGDRENLEAFNSAFLSLMGRATALADSEMAAFGDFVLPLVYPPNPNRHLDNSLPDAPPGQPSAARGQAIYLNAVVQADGKRCVDCHSVTNGTNTLLVNHAALQESQDFKVPHLRNLYRKYGFIDQPGAINKRGFGYTHDGSVDTLFDFVQNPRFTFPNGDDDRRDLDAFLRCFDTGMAPAVGYQIGFDGTNIADPEALARVDTLRGQSDAGNCDLVAKGRVSGQPRGWLYQGSDLWMGDKTGESTIATAGLLALADLGSEVTLAGVPKGSGQRIGLDRDRDTYLDGDELDAGSDPGNPASIPVVLGVPRETGPALGLQAVRPNPFRSSADMEFTLSAAGPVDLRIYDVLGREVRAIARGEHFEAGTRRLRWDGRRADGGQAGAGVYFVRLELAGRQWTRAIVRVR